jgi:hypothetical protein
LRDHYRSPDLVVTVINHSERRTIAGSPLPARNNRTRARRSQAASGSNLDWRKHFFTDFDRTLACIRIVETRFIVAVLKPAAAEAGGASFSRHERDRSQGLKPD